MKILTSEQIRKVDAETIRREGITSLELMKRASLAFFDWFTEKHSDKNLSVIVFAGVGNNGGDALVVARMLSNAGYRVGVCVVEYSSSYSEDCAHNLRRIKADNISYKIVSDETRLPDISVYDIVVDGIFGTGLSREVTGIAAAAINKINESGKPVVSIDVPSGLFIERNTTFAVKAADTVTLQIPKLALFLPENSSFTGDVSIVNIGLNEKVIDGVATNFFYTSENEVAKLIKPLLKFAHKGTQGHALIIGGSFGKMGSVCMAAKAALKMGCGLVTSFIPKCGVPVIQSYFPEGMALSDSDEEVITSISYDILPDAIGIGVGMGLDHKTEQAFFDFIVTNKLPLVVDADGLNILSRNRGWLSYLPSKTILTPHPKELWRLIGEWSNDYDKIEKTMQLARMYDLIVVVKGAYSLIIDSDNIFVNSSGTPALATAGSGDVLTGMLTGLLAQGYSAPDAARLGVYMHGMTAEITKNTICARSFTASDIIDSIGDTYRILEKRD